MGGRNSQPARKVNHFYFGEVLKKKSFNKDVICVTRPILNKVQFDDWKQKYDLVNEMNKECLLVPEGFDYRPIQNKGPTCGGCCGAQNEYEMTYEDVDFTLHRETLNRKQHKKDYSEQELLLMLYKLLQGGKEFQKKGLKVGDIRTKNILITKSGQLKMINIASFPGQRTSIEKVLDGFDNTTKFFFAPQQVQYVKSKGAAKEEVPNPKTEAWSIGLCVLQAATLENSQDIYEMPGRKINESTLNKRMSQVQQRCRILYDFLSMIIKMDSSQRMSSGECWACMRPYSEKITQLESFTRKPADQNASVRKYQTEGSGRR